MFGVELVNKALELFFGLSRFRRGSFGLFHGWILQRWLLKRPRFHLHFTPTSASWLNLVERWFALLTEQQLRRGVFHSTRNLETTIRNYIDAHNEEPKPFIWTKTADEILASVARFCQRTFRNRTLDAYASILAKHRMAESGPHRQML